MQREYGIFILTDERNEKHREEFQGIILEETYDKEYVQISIGQRTRSTGEYYIVIIDTILAKDILPIENIKEKIQVFFEKNYPENVKMGFPEIAIKEGLKKMLVNNWW